MQAAGRGRGCRVRTCRGGAVHHGAWVRVCASSSEPRAVVINWTSARIAAATVQLSAKQLSGRLRERGSAMPGWADCSSRAAAPKDETHTAPQRNRVCDVTTLRNICWARCPVRPRVRARTHTGGMSPLCSNASCMWQYLFARFFNKLRVHSTHSAIEGLHTTLAIEWTDTTDVT